MGRPQTLSRGARITGTVACALVALLSLGWIVRDVAVTGDPGQVWWMWAGVPPTSVAGQGVGVSGLTDLALVLVCGAAACTVPRSPAAASVLVAAGLLTVALRLPSLWILTSDWTRLWGDQRLRTLALTGAAVAVALGLVLLLVAVAGRRPPGPYGEEPDARPGPAAARTACALLTALACVRAAWEVYRVHEYGWDVYRGALTGSRNNVLSLLHTPAAWQSLVLVLIALVAAVAALRRAGFSRPLGMTAAAVAVLWGALGLSVAAKSGLLADLGSGPANLLLSLAGSALSAVAGTLLLVVLAGRGRRDGDARGYGPLDGDARG